MIRWLRRLAFRFARHAPTRTPSAEHWRTGDLAECISTGLWMSLDGVISSGPAIGERHVVRAVDASSFDGRQMLTFARFAPRCFDAGCFRKIVPQADAPIVADRAFLDRLIGVPAPQDDA